MGIQGLWQVLEPTGRPVNVHSLRGKILAVDVSIWLHQLVKGFRDKDGNPLPNAHLLGVFHRVCKLLNYGIKPVFVFDGGIPVLKRQTLAARRNRKLESLDKAELSRQKILSAYLQQQLLRHTKQALPPSLRMQQQISRLAGGSPKKSGGSPRKQLTTGGSKVPDGDKVDEDLEAFRAALVAKLEDDVDEVDPKCKAESSEEELDADPSYHYGVDYSENFSVIQAPEFDTLPLETQHEILYEMQESRKMNSWGKFDKMPKDLQSFSSFQMDRLVKRRTLQKKIQSVQQEMGQRHIHVQNLDDLLKMDYSAFENQQTQVATSKNDGFVLIKSQETPKKKIGESINEEPKPGTSKSSAKSAPQVITIDDFIEDSFSDDDDKDMVQGSSNKSISGKVPETKINSNIEKITKLNEEEEDLKLAIELSLMESKKVEDKSKQSFNVEVIDDIDSLNENPDGKMGQGETSFNQEEQDKDDNPLESIQSSQMSHCAKFLDTVGFHVPLASTLSSSSISKNSNGVFQNDYSTMHSSNELERVGKPEPEGIVKTLEEIVQEKVESSDGEEDDDFEEVEMVEREPKVVVTLNVADMKPMEEDLFADVFNESTITINESEKVQKEDPKVNKRQEEEMDRDDEPKLDESPTQLRNRENMEECLNKWDSDNEIEADLIDMVVKESLNSLHETKKGRVSENLEVSITSSTSSDLASMEANEHIMKESKPETLEKRESVKMITAEYMQAQDQLKSKLEKLHSDRGQQERVAASISDQMQMETQELISLFGIPYVVSPTEAESQCAFLDKACLTEGSITDDSDVWLFGGQRVYKNFFSQGEKHTEFYQAADIQRILNLDREKLIVLAMMIGSDYSDGIQGVGPVLALEILSEFSSSEVDGYECLVKFKEWWEEIQTKPFNIFSGSKVKEKLRKLKLSQGFPNKSVYEAFANPSIDTSTEAFKWGNPDLDAIRGYTKQKFGWEHSKCDSLLNPVLKNLRCETEHSRQLTLDSYISFGKMPSLEQTGKRKRGSKRMETAVKKLRRIGVESHELNLSSESSDSEKEEETKSRLSRKNPPKQTTTKRKQQIKNTSKEEGSAHEKSEEDKVAVPAPSSRALAKSAIPKKEVIPQRIQSESDKIKNKLKAIEIFKKKSK